ncbi:MAG: sigma 54-interacting transcriptional regulator [Spirochaetaceae bacterium]|nr:sigma 54-interacting transcriptional regulator [Spirochaetaceae bacterium]
MSSNTYEIDRLKTLIEINTLINSSYSDVDALLIYILESAMRLVECESSSLLLADKTGGTLRFRVALGPAGAKIMNIPVDINNSIAGWVLKKGESLLINDVQNDVRFSPVVQDKSGYETKTMIAIPMRVGSTCIGVIELLNKKNGQNFTRSDLEILNLLSAQASVAYQNADQFRSAQNEISVLQNSITSGFNYHTFVVQSPVMLDLVNVLEEVAKTNSSVLILGESGVGKELFAEQLHLKSTRSDKPFVRVNCAALSPLLLESELFGHVKGAFTNAVSDRAGRFEAADGGTIFLDEIGELPLDLQVKLLRVIQSKSFEKVGSSETISVDVRIIAATNRDLEAMVQEGTFRRDLYYRLNVLPLYVPPLRSRKEDIEPLSRLFLRKFSGETKKNFTGFSEDAIKILYSYYWPGNIRELENTIERACVLGKPPLIRAEDFRLQTGSVSSSSKEVYDSDIYDTGSRSEDRSLKAAVNRFKKAYITRILDEVSWNQTKACKILDVQRTYVSRLLNELHIREDRSE